MANKSAKLTKTEKEVYKLLCEEGLGFEEVAGKLFITKSCVKTHVLNIYAKLKMHSRAELIFTHWKKKFEKLIGIVKKNECKKGE